MEALHAFWAISEKVMSGFSEIEREIIDSNVILLNFFGKKYFKLKCDLRKIAQEVIHLFLFWFNLYLQN